MKFFTFSSPPTATAWAMKTSRRACQRSTHRVHSSVKFVRHSCQASSVVQESIDVSMDSATISFIQRGAQPIRPSSVWSVHSTPTRLARRVSRWRAMTCRSHVSSHAQFIPMRAIMITLERLWSSHGVNLWITTWHWLQLRWVSLTIFPCLDFNYRQFTTYRMLQNGRERERNSISFLAETQCSHG